MLTVPWLSETPFFLCLCPQALLLEVTLKVKSLLTGILGDHSFRVINIEHVVLYRDLFICFLVYIPVVERRLLQSEVSDVGTCIFFFIFLVLKFASHSQVVVSRHLGAIRIAQGVALSRTVV